MKRKDKEELQKLTDEILKDASLVVKDYVKNPSDESGSFVHIHEHSPYLATREERLITFDGKKIKIKPDKKA